ncbi:GNAT family N-acetyltransferase [soil metagenome]
MSTPDTHTDTDTDVEARHAGLTFRTLDASAHDGPDRDLVRGFGEAVVRGFHDGRMTDEHVAVWLEGARGDGQRFTGAWPERTAIASPHVPVATFSSWSGGDLNVGAGHSLPLHMISDVTVSPTHRRRGLMRKLMDDDLHAAAARGHALAGLTATEGSIYGRFGFGPATRLHSVEVDVSERFRLRPSSDDGSLELVDPADAWAAMVAVQRRHQSITRGGLTWPAFYEAFATGRFSWDNGGPDRKLQVVLHLDADGEPDGFASWTHKGEQDGVRTVDAGDVVAHTPGGYLALWQFLAGIDLTRRVRWGRAPLVDALPWALVDPRCVTTTNVRDMLWLRVLDVVTALEARPWYADGTVVLGIEDAVGLIDGSWQVTVTDGRAAVTRSDEAPEVSLTADTLGALYLGGVDVATLHAAGRITGDPAAVGRWATLADGGPTPYCTTGF